MSMTGVLIMPLPAAWAHGLIHQEPGDMDDAAWNDCQVVIEQMRNDGYAVIAIVDGAVPRFTSQYQLCSGNADSGMVLDYVVHGGQPIPPERDLL